MPDCGGQGEDALGDSCADSGKGAAVVAFEVELAFERLVHGFDDLAQGFEELGSWPGFFAFPGAAQEGDAAHGQARLELRAEVVFVPDQHLLVAGMGQRWCAGEHVVQGVAFVGFGTGQ